MMTKGLFIEDTRATFEKKVTKLEGDLFAGALLQDAGRGRLGQALEVGLLVAGVEVVAGLLLLLCHTAAVVLLLLAGAWASLLSLLCRRLVHAVLELPRPEQ